MDIGEIVFKPDDQIPYAQVTLDSIVEFALDPVYHIHVRKTGAAGRHFDMMWALVQTSLVPSVLADPRLIVEAKKGVAKLSRGMAAWMVNEIKNTATITIAADATGDGLQTSASAGNPTTHPAAPVVLSVQ